MPCAASAIDHLAARDSTRRCALVAARNAPGTPERGLNEVAEHVDVGDRSATAVISMPGTNSMPARAQAAAAAAQPAIVSWSVTRETVTPARRGTRHELVRRAPSVGRGRMGMKIDQRRGRGRRSTSARAGGPPSLLCAAPGIR